ncbi:MAG: 16S rRNA (adenine(1518)-N(6)/adenine(1519)-N(6))-dimethyltransferase RsmA [Gammaproteobacteria bacterium]|jgi:16S rRNA (adenine1518-N6/adenine1519-N6)-dimethyltransferase
MSKSVFHIHQPRKRFGQNFLQDEGIIAQIIAAINPQENDLMVEIGPGLGALTCELLPKLRKLHVIEFDRDLIPQLKQHCADLGELIVHQADVLEFNFSSLITTAMDPAVKPRDDRIKNSRNDKMRDLRDDTKEKKLRAVGNLPYNISSPIIFHLLKFAPLIKDMHFMLQKEVVDRLSASVGTKAYGRLTVMVQYFCEARKLFDVLPAAFYPKPKVTSSFVRLVSYEKLPVQAKDFTKFAEIVKIAFNQRRKTLRNALKSIITAKELERLGVDPKLRPEQLSVTDYVRISNNNGYRGK